MKVFVNALCCLIPSKKLRKSIRNKLVKSRERHRMLLDSGCTIEGDVASTKDGVKFDISDYAKVCTHVIEIFVKDTYSLCCKDDLIVIDIGMNRAVASLYFASKENVKKVYAFEPFEPTLALAKRNLELNPELSAKILTFGYALGKEDTILEIPYSVNVSDCMSTTHSISVKQDVRTEKVAVKDAAGILAPIFEENRQNRIVIKCDCEGAEFEILERMNEEGLVGKIDAILMEYHFKNPDRLVQILAENCFAVHIHRGERERPITGYLYAVNMQKTS